MDEIPEGFHEEVNLLKLNAYAANQTRRLIAESLADHQDGIDRMIAQQAAMNAVILERAAASSTDPTT